MSSHRAFRALSFSLFLLLLPPLPCFAQGQAIPDAAKYLFDATNRERTSRDLPALQWDNALASSALAHARLMARQGILSHQLSGEPDLAQRAASAGVRFSALAENIAYGPSTSTIHSGWMHSPPHRASILDPRLNSLGVAVVQQGDLLYAVEDFSRAIPQLSLGEQETRVAAQLKKLGLRLAPYTDQARAACSAPSSFGGHPQPHAIERFESQEIDVLPGQLLGMIRDGHYSAAAVGACPPQHARASSGYRLAVLLY